MTAGQDDGSNPTLNQSLPNSDGPRSSDDKNDTVRGVMGAPDGPPLTATGAVLLASQPVPDGAQVVSGIDFNQYQQDITVSDLVAAMAVMGFQATAVADAVKIISEMVYMSWKLIHACLRVLTAFRETGEIPRQG